MSKTEGPAYGVSKAKPALLDMQGRSAKNVLAKVAKPHINRRVERTGRGLGME